MHKTIKDKADYFRRARVGYYVVRYKLNDVMHCDKYDNSTKPGFVLTSLQKRGAKNIVITKF